MHDQWQRAYRHAAAGVLLAVATLVVSTAASAQPAIDEQVENTHDDALKMLERVDQMLEETRRMQSVLQDQADSALLAAQSTSDPDIADRRMRLYFELQTRIAEIDEIQDDLRRRADQLRTILKEGGSG